MNWGLNGNGTGFSGSGKILANRTSALSDPIQ